MGEMGNLNTLKCMLARSQACVIVQTVFLVIFFRFFLLDASKEIAEILFIFSSINMFCVPLRAHFNPGLAARATMTLSRAQNIGVPKKINTIV